MSNRERRDFDTRFKKGQSGNPKGRPQGRKNNSSIVRDVLFKPIRVNDGNTSRNVPKIAAALEVCLNNALKGDLRAFIKVLDVAERFNSFQPEPHEPRFSVIRHVIVDPKDPTSEDSTKT
jgi:hypothetical protein